MYGSRTLADTYFATKRLGGEAWALETENRRDQALEQATSAIDRLNFAGVKTDDDQTNQFPRDDDTTVPDDILNATYECAFAFLQGVDIEKEAFAASNESTQMGPLREQRQPDVHHCFLNGIPSVVAWNFLFPYLITNRTVSLSRVN